MTSEGRWRANKESSAGKLGINEARPPSHYLHLCSMFLMYIHCWEKADLLYLLLQQPESHVYVGMKDMKIRWSLGSAEEGDKKVSFLTSVWSQVTFQFPAAPNRFRVYYKEHHMVNTCFLLRHTCRLWLLPQGVGEPRSITQRWKLQPECKHVSDDRHHIWVLLWISNHKQVTSTLNALYNKPWNQFAVLSHHVWFLAASVILWSSPGSTTVQKCSSRCDQLI